MAKTSKAALQLIELHLNMVKSTHRLFASIKAGTASTLTEEQVLMYLDGQYSMVMSFLQLNKMFDGSHAIDMECNKIGKDHPDYKVWARTFNVIV